MKTSHDPRHVHRQKIVQTLFANTFHTQPSNDEKVIAIFDNQTAIDEAITRIAPEFPIDKLNKIDLAILRLGVYELMLEQSQPQKVVIDEAIELAKEFGGSASPSFINGALGKLMKDMEEDK
jgi:N utilization substance protein B